MAGGVWSLATPSAPLGVFASMPIAAVFIFAGTLRDV